MTGGHGFSAGTGPGAVHAGWVAYVDESMRHPRRGETGAYVLAATMLADTDVEQVRQEVLNLSTASGLRFHWREEMRNRRSEAVGLVKRLPALHQVVVETPLDPSRQERCRRLCLHRLLFDLDAHGVAVVVMETRTRSLNGKDTSAIDAWRSQGLINRTTRVSHADPAAEPLLWLPDIVAGAVSASEAGNPRWADELAPLATIIRTAL